TSVACRPPSNQTTDLPSFASAWAWSSVRPSPLASFIEMSLYFWRSLKLAGSVMIAASCGRPSLDLPISKTCIRSDSESIFCQYAPEGGGADRNPLDAPAVEAVGLLAPPSSDSHASLPALDCPADRLRRSGKGADAGPDAGPGRTGPDHRPGLHVDRPVLACR